MASATIKQRTARDCFLCCAAMLAGISYDELVRKVSEETIKRIQERGTYSDDIYEVFKKLGLQWGFHYTTISHPNDKESADYVSPSAARRLLWGRKAMIQAKSITGKFEGEFHMLYWDGRNLHDPGNDAVYTWDKVEPVYTWIFSSETEPF